MKMGKHERERQKKKEREGTNEEKPKYKFRKYTLNLHRPKIGSHEFHNNRIWQ
jgi:hypothetical protein